MIIQKKGSVYFLHSVGVLGIGVEDLRYYTLHPWVLIVVQKIWDI